MKRNLKAILATLLAVVVGIGGVDAAAQKNIDKNRCDTVYTNYYFFLDANDESYFAKGLSNVHHSTIAKYSNNSYLTDKFNTSNIGYGQVDINRSTTTSRDGISSMSLDDYFTYYLRAIANSNGTYKTGNKNFIVAHTWYAINPDNTTTHKVEGYNLNGFSKSQLIGASLNATATLTVQSAITPNQINPFEIRVDRHYYGSLTGAPLAKGNSNIYLNPQIYYIQYCEDKKEEPVREYTIAYYGNGTNTNVPKDETITDGECTKISTKTPRRTGYEFLGWSTNRNATKPDRDYDPGDQYCGEEGSIDLYAVWKKIEDEPTPAPEVTYYYIYYRTNTNDTVTGMPDTGKQDTNYDIYISTNRPVRAGYTFLGWSTDPNATVADPNYNGGILYQDRKDLVLYAVWQKNNTPSPLPSNPQTGITDYLLPFGGVISASGAGLGLLKKKKSFKQF